MGASEDLTHYQKNKSITIVTAKFTMPVITTGLMCVFHCAVRAIRMENLASFHLEIYVLEPQINTS